MKKANFTLKDVSRVKNARLSFSAEGARDCCTSNGFSHFLKAMSLVFLFVGFGVVDSFAQCPINTTLHCESDLSSVTADIETAAITAAEAAFTALGCTINGVSTAIVTIDNRDGNDCTSSMVHADVTLNVTCAGSTVMVNCVVRWTFLDTEDPTEDTAAGTPGAWACGDPVPANPSDPTGMDNCDPTVTVTQTGGFPDIVTDACGLRTATWTWDLSDDCGNTTTITRTAVESFSNSDIVFSNFPVSLMTARCYDTIMDNGDGTGNLDGHLYSITASAPCIPGGFTVTSSVSAPSDPTCFGTGTATLTFVATANCDATKTATMTQVITLNDTTAPYLVGGCPPSLQTVVVDGNCAATVPDLTGTIMINDDCGPNFPTVIQSVAAGTAFTTDDCVTPGQPVGADVVVNLAGMNCAGVTSATLCTVTLRPVDTTPPTISGGPVNLMVPFDGTTCTTGTITLDAAALTAAGVMVTDNCDPNPTLTCTTGCGNTYGCADIGTSVTVMVTGTDCNTNTSAATAITVNIVGADNFTAEWTNPGPLCADAATLDLNAFLGTSPPNAAATPTCGTWSGDNVTSAGIFTRSTAGNFAVTYTVGQPGCHVELTRVIEVIAQPSVGTPTDASVCVPVPVAQTLDRDFLFPGSTDGGSLTGDAGNPAGGATISGDEILFTIPGCYQFSYEFSGAQASPCAAVAAATVTVQVNEEPEPSFDLAEEVCWDGVSTVTLTPLVNSLAYVGTPTRAWSSTTPAVATVDAGTGVVTIAGAGTTSICLTETISVAACGTIGTALDCSAQVCHTLTVNNASSAGDPSFTNPGPLCSDDAAVTLTVTGTAGGIFSGNGVTGNMFDPNAAGAGTHAVTYTLNNNGCTAVMTQNIVVHGAKAANVDYHPIIELACATELLDVNGLTASISGVQLFSQYSAGTFDLSGLWITGVPSGGTWSLTSAPHLSGLSGTVVGEVLYFTDPGCYEVSYSSFSGANGGCVVTASVYVAQKPVPGLDLPDMFCFHDLPNGGANGHQESADAFVTSPNYFNATPDATLSTLSNRTFNSSNTAVVSFNQTGGSGAGTLGTFDISINGIGTAVVTMEEHFFGTSAGCANGGNGTFCSVQTQQTIEVRGITFSPQACACANNLRVVDLGTVTTPAGIESGAPFSVQFSGGNLDLNEDGTADVTNGTHLAQEGNDLGHLILNSGEESWSITIVDNKGCEIFRSGDCSNIPNAPTVASCPMDMTVTTSANTAGDCNAAVTYTAPTFDDNCDGTGLAGTLTEGLASGADFPLGDTEVEYTFTDSEGNSVTCDFTVTVVDDENPTLTCPAGVSVQCVTSEAPTADNLAEFLIQGGMFSENCTIDEGTFSSLGEVPGIGNTVIRTYSIQDEANNGALCMQTITILDTQNPQFQTCPNNITYGSAPSACGMYVNWVEPYATDNCSVQQILRTNNSGTANLTLFAGDLFPVGTTTIEYTAFDPTGNEDQCLFTVTVIDNVDPVISCPTASAVLQVGTNNDCTFDMGSDAFNASASDNCNVATLVHDYNGGGTTLNGENFPLGNTTVNWTATDDSGNTASCSIIVTVSDDDDPTVTAGTCPADITANTSDNVAGDCDAAVTYTAPTFDDNCDGAAQAGTLTEGLASGSDFPVGVTTVTWEYTDAAGNGPAVCSFTVTVTDDENPSISCPANVEVDCDPSEAPEFDNLQEFTDAGGSASDNCDLNEGSFGLSNVAQAGNVYTRTYTVEDIYGNSNSCDQTVTVIDDVNPMAMCQGDYTVTLDADGAFEIIVTDIENGSTDNCGSIVRKEIDINGGGFGQSGLVVCNDVAASPITVTLEVEDAAGNTDQCTVMVTVLDVNDPSIQCPTVNLVRGTNNDCTFDMGSDDFNASADDNCGFTLTHNYNGGGTTLNGENFPLGNTTVEWTATDDSGNSASCEMIITVVDDDDPTVTAGTCPADITANTSDNVPGDCDAAVTYTAPTFDDNCDGAALAGTLTEGLTSGSDFPVGTTTVTWEYTDAAGNGPAVCSFTVTVVDDELPTISCPPATTVQCSTDEEPTADNFVEFIGQGGVAFDNCELDDFWIGASEAIVGNIATRTYSINDVNGNINTCDQIITIADTEDPTFAFENCPQNIVVNNDPDKCGANVNWQGPDADDNCGVVQLLQTDGNGLANGDFFSVGTHAIQYTAFDAAGNDATCDFTVTVNDMQNPDIECPTVDLVKGTNNGCSFDMGSDAFNAAFSDNCPGATLSNDYNGTNTLNGAIFPLGNTTIVWTATDAVGNTATCSMTITVVDDVDPIVNTCPADDTVTNDIGVCGAAYTYAVPTFDDNCDGTGLTGTLVEGLASGSVFPVGTTTVTWEYSDAAGNGPISCSFDVTVTDDEAPAITCPPAATAQCSADEVAEYDNLPEFFSAGGTATDNCAIDDLLFGLVSETSAGNVVTRTYSITDINGNANTCTQDITISDTTDPVFTNCPTGPVVVGNDPDECSAKVNWSIPVATDNCPGVVVTHSGAVSGSVLDVGSHTATYTATDLAGNTTTCDITIMVMDTQDPFITVCAADRDVANDPGVCEATVPDMTGEIEFIENCPGAVVTQVPAAGSTFGAAPGDQVTVTFTVTDASGNTAQCTNTLTLIDTENPNAVCANITVGLDVFGYASVTPLDIGGASTDNCGIASIEFVSGQTDYNCADVGNTYDVTIRVTDTSGNTAECTGTVTVTEGVATCDPTLAIFDPCVCSVIPGFFDELVTVNALAGQTWTVVSISGLMTSPGNPITVGTTMTEGPLGVYELAGIHAAGVGYSITVENEFGQQLSVANTCYNPEPEIDGVDDFSTACDDPFTITGSEANGAAGDGVLTVSGPNFNMTATGAPASITIDPSTLNPGDYTACYSFDAGTASNNNPNDPGCVVEVCEEFTIINPITGIVCNNEVNVSLDETCVAVITPDMVLEGNIGPDGVFDVTIKDQIGTPLNPANEVNASHIGGIWIVTVTDPCTGQSCWGELNVEDKLAPELTCPADITVYCNEDTDPSVTGDVGIQDCSAIEHDEYTDDETFFDNCSDPIRVIQRHFVVRDIHGNQSECAQTITVARPQLSQIEFPLDIQWTCDNYKAYENIIDATALHEYVGDSKPVVTPLFIEVHLDETCDDDDGNLTGFCPTPFPGTFNDTKDRPDMNSTNTINGGQGCPGEVCGNNGLDDADVLELTGSGIPLLGGIPFQGVGPCMLSVKYDDEWFEICSGSFEILRTWKVRDMCLPLGPDNPRVHTQVIKVLDQKAPKLSGPASITVEANIPATHPDECRAAFFLPEIDIEDNCSEGWTVEVDHPLGHIDDNGGYVEGLTRGTHTATYTVIDDCGNVATWELEIIVEDGIAPTVQCDEITTATLSSDGKVTIAAEVFDDGTHDNCCLDEFTVRRMSGGGFAPSVTFNCNDINNSPVMVVMRASDCDGNTNECMVEVIIEDKLPPIVLTCPSPQRITCDFYWDNIEVGLALGDDSVLDQFGEPQFKDNCSYNVNYTYNVNLDECGEGSITRTWQATDPSGNGPATCTQIIFVDHVSDWAVEFPADLTEDCGNAAPDFGEPRMTRESCELIATSYEDQYFNSVPDACYKIKRTWQVINWCVVGDFVDQEVVEVSERDYQLAGMFPCDLDGDGDCDDRTFRDSWTMTAKPTAANATDIFGPDTDSDTDPWDGYITYEQNIKVIDNVAPVLTCAPHQDVCIDDNSCDVDFSVPVPDVQECSSEITITATSDLPNFNAADVSADDVPEGDYQVTFQVMDNCGNSAACQTTVTVTDCKKPTPYCKNGIIIELMQSGEVEVWASDLNDSSFDNCTAQDDLIFSFSDDTDDIGITFNCDHVGQQIVEIWVTDEAENQDYCTTSVIIQDNMGACPGTNPLVVVQGGIMTEDNEGIALVDVELNGGSQMVTTGDDGQYSFNVPQGDDITITPVKDIDPLNGVTTFDLVLITKHILGVKVLDSPYKIIAADINKSETITTFDLVKLRKLILHVDDNFTNNTSWRFVDADYVFQDPANPLAENFLEVVSINNVPANVTADFIGVKVGDVNGSANPLDLTSTEDRNMTNDLVFSVEDTQLESGETYTVNFLAKDFDVLGYQFTLNFDTDALDFVEIMPGVATRENFGLRFVEEGAITASWNEDARQVENGEVVFSLVFTAKDAAQLSDVLDVNSRYTAAEAYSNDGELLDVAIEFNGQIVEVFELYQNTPNPFKETTIIGFNLPQADAATLTVTDATGRVIQIIEGEYAKGYNQITLDRKALGAAGVLYYQLETSTDTATKTMLLVE